MTTNTRTTRYRLVTIVLFALVVCSAASMFLQYLKFMAQKGNNDSSTRKQRSDDDEEGEEWSVDNEKTTTDGIVDYSFIERCVYDFDEGQITPFQIASGWDEYRLGDCIKLCKACDSANITGTVAEEYNKHSCPGGTNNLTAVEEIFQRRALWQQSDTPFAVPDPDELVIHLRLGDVIEKSTAPVEKMLLSGADPKHAIAFKSSIKSVHEVLANIQESRLRRVSIRGGSHKPELFAKSRVYAGCLKQAIEFAGYQVTMSLDHTTPDQDFYYMSHAHKIVVSTGGYSRLIGKLVERRGGSIIGRTFR